MPCASCNRQEERSQRFVIEEGHRHAHRHANAHTLHPAVEVTRNCSVSFRNQEPNSKRGKIRGAEAISRWKDLCRPKVVIRVAALLRSGLHFYALVNFASVGGIVVAEQ